MGILHLSVFNISSNLALRKFYLVSPQFKETYYPRIHSKLNFISRNSGGTIYFF